MPYVLFFRNVIISVYSNFASNGTLWFIFALRYILCDFFFFLLLIYKELYFRKVENENIGLK